MQEHALPIGLLASLLFTLVGPIALLPAFASLAGAASRAMQLRIALLAAATALITFAIAVFVGAAAMASAGTSASSLIMAAGLVLLLTALRNIFGQGQPRQPRPAEPSLALGFAPIALPGIATPAGVAIIIIFASYFPTTADRFAIMGVVTAIMAANVLAMLGATAFMRLIGPAPLQVLGAVFGVLQAAMGTEMLMSGLARAPAWAG